ncbi:ATP-binding protein [Quatrionicoccus australiensis]|uniref:ATP-binding protein n=1 Tax=Quatrionicoccus australiensis TaxID=138118 RepID=UPI001CFAD0C8|nr:ATP-binding protein [Quatrionicoccus australiensis]MCB4358619.1 HAMP domain-containing histidine kinase [Quatrionicoccus australiensis]
MPFISSTSDGSDYLANLRRLVASRWPVLGATALLVMIAPGLLAIPVQQALLLAIIGITALFNAFAQWRLQDATAATPHELFSQLLVDIATLSALVFFSGGATNPLISLLLPPVAIAALSLPTRGVLGVMLVAIAAYSLLMVFYIPLPVADASRATQLHLVGMWLTFAVSAAMIAWFVVRMTRLIRERDAELAAAREQSLRDERVMAIGTLAAGAAHELGTPLGTIALLAGELAHDFAANPALPESARQDIAQLRQQIGVCKQIITGLSRRAGAERLENTPRQPVDRWLDEIRLHWHAIRPQANSRLICGSTGPAPEIAADPRLEQAILNLLNNAANACGGKEIEIGPSWSGSTLNIDIHDRGPGFPAEVLAVAGQSKLPAHAHGSGIGLMLTRSAIEQLGGKLLLSNPDAGGALARIELPLTN